MARWVKTQLIMFGGGKAKAVNKLNAWLKAEENERIRIVSMRTWGKSKILVQYMEYDEKYDERRNRQNNIREDM